MTKIHGPKYAHCTQYTNTTHTHTHGWFHFTYSLPSSSIVLICSSTLISILAAALQKHTHKSRVTSGYQSLWGCSQ